MVSAWRILKEDRAMQEIILIRLRVMKEDKAKTKLLELGSMLEPDHPQEGRQLRPFEMEEHGYLDTIMVDEYSRVGREDSMVETDSDWEIIELDDLDKIPEDEGDETATKDN